MPRLLDSERHLTDVHEMVQALKDDTMRIWICVDTSKQIGDKDHLKVFASEEAANRWFAEHDPEGVAFEYGVSPIKEVAS